MGKIEKPLYESEVKQGTVLRFIIVYFSSLSALAVCLGFLDFSAFSALASFTGLAAFLALTSFTGLAGFSALTSFTGLAGFSALTSFLALTVVLIFFSSQPFFPLVVSSSTAWKVVSQPFSVFTGGDAIYFAKRMKNSIFVVCNLVLIGLALIATEYDQKD